MRFHLTCVHIILVRFRLLSAHLLGICYLCILTICTMGDPEIRGKVLLNRVAFIDCNEKLQI